MIESRRFHPRMTILKLVSLVACAILLSGFGVSGTSAAFATEIRIPALTAAPGQQIEMPVVIDEIDNLAGMKLVIDYDPNQLVYKSTAKAKEAASLIHIVNDKRPGTLIVVMAGARGIKGKNLRILTLHFTVKEGTSAGTSIPIDITESQLMSDKLKDLQHTVKTSPVAVSQDPKAPKPSSKQ